MSAFEIEPFLGFLADNGKSKNTIATYHYAMRKFDAWLETQPVQQSLWGAQARQLHEYFDYLKTTQRAKPATINLTRGALFAFYAWGREQELITWNPAEKLRRISAVKGAPKALSEDKMDQLINFAQFYAGGRNGAIVLTLLMTGLRESELCNLIVKDVDFKRHVIAVYSGKGEKYREVPLPSQLSRQLHNYITTERESTVSKLKRPLTRSYLFVSQKGRISRSTVFRIVNQLGSAAGIEDCHPHQLRHTYATVILNKTGDLTAVSALLGHASIATTQIYTRPTQERLAERVQAALGSKGTRNIDSD